MSISLLTATECVALAQPLHGEVPHASHADGALAQNGIPPQDITPPDFPDDEELEPEIPAPLPPPEELLPSPLDPGLPEEPQDIPGVITVTEFLFEGNTAFSNEELQAEVQEFLNRPLTFAELLQARSAITNLYVENGYITSGAFVPPQNIRDGVVTIQVVEGSLEAINIEIDGRLATRYVRSRLELASKPPVNQDRLLEALQLLLLDPIIENVSAELSAGTQPGTSLLDVRVEVADTWRGLVRLDNGRSPSVGSFRRRVGIAQDNLLGFGDSLSFEYTNTDGSNQYETNYVLPINARNGTIEARFSYTDSEIIEEPFDEVNIEATSETYELTWRQPIIRTPTRELSLGITAAREESNTFLLETSFPLSEGANEFGETKISSIRLFQEWVQRDTRSVFAARSQFSIGTGAFAATINDDEPDSRYFAWRGQVQYLRLLAPDTLFLVRSDIQLTPHELLPLEQFGLGGFESVRGYRQDTLLTDNGILISAEVRFPLFRPFGDGLVQIVPFVDIGTAWNINQANPDPNTLIGAGIGLRWEQSDTFSARLEWGIPLIDVDSRGDTLQEEGIYFSVIWNPF